ncbi:MAG: hypothetical protein Q7T45_23755 [Bradyrhizobium sp.]|uniref:hypothetical protein n=1 Tax=Bradyrhizobium sp. TaxID=376 RepID=UPI002724124C|nr:hypothetical protein [Bradyrhizobium sp.]MDO8400834.1 hypothetical protein [Bradyrhizobium sp.]
MLSRALSLATVTLLIGCLAAIPVRAQNLEAGKSPSQIFSGTCTACHKGARGLLKTVAPGSLPGFLRQHYTTSSEMASQLSAFLIANGATAPDPRGAKPTQQAKDAKPAAPEQLDRNGRPIRPAPAPEAARPDGEPQQAAIAPGPDGRKSAAKQKLSKRGKPEEPPKVDAAKDEPAKSEAVKDDTAKSEPAKEAVKDAAAKPPGEANSQSAHVAAPKENGETPALRSDPVPPVTPAPAMSAAISSGSSEPAAMPAPPLAMLPAPPAKASGPPLPPVPPAGPPAPPISQ